MSRVWAKMVKLLKCLRKVVSKWCVIVPIAYLIPRDKHLVLFWPVDHLFYENVKYLYLYLHKAKEKNIKYYLVTEARPLYELLKKNELPVLFHPTLLSRYLLLRANIFIVASGGWHKRSKYYLLFGAKIIQLWHGIPLKRIQLAVPGTKKRIASFAGKIDSAIRGKDINYDVVVSTSEFFTREAFSKAFRAKLFLESGYPRNDIFFNGVDDRCVLLGSDIEAISKISRLRADGYKIILYAPTYRDTGGDAVRDGVLNLGALSEFAKRYKAVFVFKFHRCSNHAYGLKKHRNIIEYGKLQDIQPLLKLTDVLITDYSSVYMDFLLLDRPIIFFPYDYEKYIEKDRELFFDYDWITPGPKCYSQVELKEALRDYIVGEKDDFAAKRKEIRDLAFKHKDGNASERIWSFIKGKYINS